MGMMGAFGIVSAKTPLANPGTGIAGTYVNYSGVEYPVFKQTGVLETSTTTSGTRKWEWNSDGYFNTWRDAVGSQVLAGYNTVISPFNSNASGFWGNNSGGAGALLPITASGRYYTCNITSAGVIYQSQPMSVLETIFNPVPISVVAQAGKTNLLSVVNPIAAGIGNQQIYIELAFIIPGDTEAIVDAVRVWYSPSFSADIGDDILKMGNFGENISSYRSGKKFIVENRPMITDRDTIFLRSSNLAVNGYRFKINTFDFVQTNLSAFLIDNYLKTATAIQLTGVVNALDFAVTADAASAHPERFMIVFAANKLQTAGMYIQPAQHSNQVAFDWKVSSQQAVARYGVEK